MLYVGCRVIYVQQQQHQKQEQQNKKTETGDNILLTFSKVYLKLGKE